MTKEKIIDIAPSSACYSMLDADDTKYRVSNVYRKDGYYHFTLHQYKCGGVIYENLGTHTFKADGVAPHALCREYCEEYFL